MIILPNLLFHDGSLESFCKIGVCSTGLHLPVIYIYYLLKQILKCHMKQILKPVETNIKVLHETNIKVPHETNIEFLYKTDINIKEV